MLRRSSAARTRPASSRACRRGRGGLDAVSSVFDARACAGAAGRPRTPGRPTRRIPPGGRARCRRRAGRRRAARAGSAPPAAARRRRRPSACSRSRSAMCASCAKRFASAQQLGAHAPAQRAAKSPPRAPRWPGYIIASRNGSRQRRAGPRRQHARRRGASARACRRRSRRASPRRRLGNSRPNSSPRSVVAGVSGSRSVAQPLSSSPPKRRRGAKPKSASSAALSTSRQKRGSSPLTCSRRAGLRSSTLSRWRRRSTAVAGVVRRVAPQGAWRSHSSSRISHRWRSASGAAASAALSSAVRSHSGAAPPKSARHRRMVSRRRAAPKPADRTLGGQRTQ